MWFFRPVGRRGGSSWGFPGDSDQLAAVSSETFGPPLAPRSVASSQILGQANLALSPGSHSKRSARILYRSPRSEAENRLPDGGPQSLHRYACIHYSTVHYRYTCSKQAGQMQYSTVRIDRQILLQIIYYYMAQRRVRTCARLSAV